MPRLPRLSGRECQRAFERAGFEWKRQSGSHVILRKDSRTVVVPAHRELAAGTLASILKQAGLTVDEFLLLLQD